MKYKRKNALVWSIRFKCLCTRCAKIGKTNTTAKWRKNISRALKGRNITWGNKISKSLTGRKDSEETIKNKSAAMTGKNNPFYGKKHTAETKRKIRLTKIKYLKEKFGHGLCPTYNPKACIIIDEYGKKYDYSFQHALNGGEFYIKELGYWVDGYDKKRNVVIEYYEKHHNRPNTKIKDKQRQQEIIKRLGCRFIIVKEENYNKGRF